MLSSNDKQFESLIYWDFLLPTLLIFDSDADDEASDVEDDDDVVDDADEDDEDEFDPDLTLNDFAGTHPGGHGFERERLVLLR